MDQLLARVFGVVKGQGRNRRDSGASYSVEVEALRLRNEMEDQRQDEMEDEMEDEKDEKGEKDEKEAEVGVLGNR